MTACMLMLAAVANTQQDRPPLEGGVEHWEPEGGVIQPPLKGGVKRSREIGICESYSEIVNPFEGRLHVEPKTGQGSRYFCFVSFPDWRLLGEDGNYCCYLGPYGGWVPKIPPKPGKPTRKPITRPTPKPPPTSSPTLTPTPPAMHCSDQVEVLSFVPRPLSGLVPHIGMPGPPHPFAGLWIMDLFAGRRFAGDRIQGITFEARVWINRGRIPVDNIHLRYIQNVTQWDGSVFYSVPPHPRATLSCGSLPILDLGTRAIPREPFYNVGFRETPASGQSRMVMISGSPHLDNIVLLRPNGSHALEINARASYTTFLGCVIGEDVDGSTFETLSTLDWRVRYAGRVIFSGGLPPYQFLPDMDAGIAAGSAIKSNRTPVMIVGNDAFNRCAVFR